MKAPFLKFVLKASLYVVFFIGCLNAFLLSKWKKPSSFSEYKEMRVLKINPKVDKEGLLTLCSFHVWLLRGFTADASKQKKEINIDLEDDSKDFDSSESSVFAKLLWFIIFGGLCYGVWKFEPPLDNPAEWVTVVVAFYMAVSGLALLVGLATGTPIWIVR